MPKFMVIETFHPNCKSVVYDRLKKHGRLLPDGLVYIDSWLGKNGERCFQLMEAKDISAFNKWIEKWTDLVDFEIVELDAKPIDNI